MAHLDVPALFVRDGARVVPTRFTQGPWDPDAQHGGPISALLAWGIEQLPTLVPMRPLRFTFDLMRPVPIAPLTVEARVLREGKKIQLSASTLVHDGVEVAHATVLRVRRIDTADLLDHPHRPPSARRPPAPSGAFTSLAEHSRMRYAPGFLQALDVERIAGVNGTGAPATVWFRCRLPLFEGEPSPSWTTPVLVADFTSGLAGYLDFERFTAVNADVTVHLLRDPRSEWVAVDTACWYEADGLGQARGTLFDTDGVIAHTDSSLVVDRQRSVMFRESSEGMAP